MVRVKSYHPPIVLVRGQICQRGTILLGGGGGLRRFLRRGDRGLDARSIVGLHSRVHLAVDHFTPAILYAEDGSLTVNTFQRLYTDESHTSVSIPRGFGAILGELYDSCDAHRCHLQRVLLRRGGNSARNDAGDARRAATIDGDNRHVLGFARLVEGGETACGGWLVDGVHQIDIRSFSKAVLHQGLALGLIP